MDIWDILTDPKVRAGMVTAAYLAATLGFFHIIYQGFKHKTYGMPPLSTAAALGFCAIVGFYGPWSDQSHLFPVEGDPHFALLVNLWRFWALLLAIILVQYFVWAKRHKSIWSDLSHFHMPKILNANLLFVLMIITLTIGEWEFIVFYQDYYVNQICPIVMLFVAIGYLGTLFLRPKLLGLSIFVAWAWAISNTLLYVAVVLGPMDDPYRNAEHGYGFIYWVYAVTLVLNFLYVYLLHKRRHELHPEYHDDPDSQTPIDRAMDSVNAKP